MFFQITDQLTEEKGDRNELNISTFNGNRAVSRCFCLWQSDQSPVYRGHWTIWQPRQIMMDSRLELQTIHRRRPLLAVFRLLCFSIVSFKCKTLLGAINQQKVLVGAFSGILETDFGNRLQLYIVLIVHGTGIVRRVEWSRLLLV